jgi:NAD(P)-dependent dehydrogenase (short-subunit alcohol dehydrogenase family)
MDFAWHFGVTNTCGHAPLVQGRQHCIGGASGCLLDFDDLQLTESFSAMKAYGRSKLCNILFTRELARRLKRRPRLSDVHI